MNDQSRESTYAAPVNQLLLLGEPQNGEQRDYSALGISAECVADLIRMATDEQLNSTRSGLQVWAPVHAWRALGQLHAAEAVAPLLELFRRITEWDDDWVQTDLPVALAQIGAAAVEPAAHYLADTSHNEWARIAAAETLGNIGQAHPDLRADCVARLAVQLEKFSEQDETLNMFLILPLVELNAVEIMPLIEHAFVSGRVDESVVGDLEDVQILFGQKTERERQRKPNRLTELHEELAGIREGIDALERQNVQLEAISDEREPYMAPEPYVAPVKIGRNEPCPCGSGKKYKKCCGA